MKRLSGLDATFLYSDTSTVFMHTLKIAIVRVHGNDPRPIGEQFREVMGDLLERLPAFRQRAVDVPFGLHHPVWCEDPDFDIEHHVERAVLTSPGTRVQLDEAIAKVAARPLPRDRPLWSITLIEGLSDDRVCFVAKIHHSVADGVASASLLSAIMAGDPNGDAASGRRRVRSLPGPIRLLWEALLDQPRHLGSLAPLAARTLLAARRAARARREHTYVPQPFDGPKTSFNGVLTSERAFASTSLDLEQVRKLKTAYGVSVNDVILTIAGRAVERYLAEQGEVYERPLMATVPVSSTAAGLRYVRGNRLSNLFTSLCTDEPDPASRVRSVRAAALAAKSVHNALGSSVMRRWAEFAPQIPYQVGFKLYSALRIAERHRPAANLIVSNVRGPAQRLFIGGAELCELISVGPILPGIGMNLTAWSYDGRVGVAVLADGVAVTNARAVVDGLQPALDELSEALIASANATRNTPSVRVVADNSSSSAA